MSDVSSYVKEVKEILKGNFMRIKDEMEPTYLTFYMNKIVSLSANKLIQNIYKCKKLPFTAYQFLQMDITEVKETLIAVVKADQSNLFSTQKRTPMPKMCRITSLLSTKPLENLKTSSNFYSFLTRSSLKDTRCSWKEVRLKILTVSCR